MNFAIGSRASRRYELEDALFRNSIDMLARLMRSGWALLPPVIAEIFVLSDDKTTPKRVAPGASFSY
jgi:hypothetical protein